MPIERVLISRGRRMPHYQADQDIVVRFRGFSSLESYTVGGGRMDTRLARKLSIICRSRLRTDEENTDKNWFTDAAFGYLSLEDSLVDCLHLFLPSDINGNALLTMPMRVVGSSDVEEDQKEPGWGFASVDFAAVLEPALNQGIQ
jgi:hypothetical protein